MCRWRLVDGGLACPCVARVSAVGVDLDQCAAVRRAALSAPEGVSGSAIRPLSDSSPNLSRRYAPPFLLPRPSGTSRSRYRLTYGSQDGQRGQAAGRHRENGERRSSPAMTIL